MITINFCKFTESFPIQKKDGCGYTEDLRRLGRIGIMTNSVKINSILIVIGGILGKFYKRRPIFKGE